MTVANDYEARRLANIKRNQELIKDLGIKRENESKARSDERPVKRRKVVIEALPSRTSARIASNPTRASYNVDELQRKQQIMPREERTGSRKSRGSMISNGRSVRSVKQSLDLKDDDDEEDEFEKTPPPDIESIRLSWSQWTPTEGQPTRDETTKTFHFASDPTFTPNKSPEEMLREGCFGGSYFRPLKSRALGIVVADDWRELPGAWIEGLNIERYLTNSEYNPDVNKYKVQCGQSIEEWEANGWINHSYDVRGWFQWYCRFFMGRRCEDDERQIRRWRNCVGETGRWKLALLRKYVKLGVRDVFDDGEEGEDAAEVSPVIHQTCHHWAYEVRQDALDKFWTRPK